jgi:hypothetical protein
MYLFIVWVSTGKTKPRVLGTTCGYERQEVKVYWKRVQRIVSFTIYYCDDKIMEDEICGTCNMQGSGEEGKYIGKVK